VGTVEISFERDNEKTEEEKWDGNGGVAGDEGVKRERATERHTVLLALLPKQRIITNQPQKYDVTKV
jgi:hypothetical protein